MQYLLFNVTRLLPSVFWGSSHVTACSLHLLTVERCSRICFCIHLLTGIWVFLFFFFTIVNKAGMDVPIEVCLQAHIFTSPVKIAKEGIAESYDTVC